MSILNRGWIYDSITRNQDSGSVSYRWTHGASDSYLGAGIFYYSIPYFLRAQTCVCLGSGGGYVPRLMVDATWELNETKMYDEGIKGEVYVVDATNSVNGEVDWADEDSYLRETFNPKFLNATTENAFYNFFVKRDIEIDYLHIDADHTYEGCKQDFDLYSTLMSENGIISIHDTDESYWESYIDVEEESVIFNPASQYKCDGPPEFIKTLDKKKYEVFSFFDHKEKTKRQTSTGLTIIKKI
jgi:hypothetical protein